MTINELLDQAKNRANLASDYALAKAMGIDRGIVSRWRKNKEHPSTENAIQLATLAGMDEMQVIAEIEMQTAKNEKKREFWRCYIEKRGFAACVSMTALAVSIMLTPEPAQAGVLQLQNYDAHHSARNGDEIYIMRIFRQFTVPWFWRPESCRD